MNDVQRGMTVASVAGNFGVVSDVSGDRITVQRDNGGTTTLETNQYTLRDGVVRIRLDNEQDDSGEIAIPVVEEQLNVMKREVETGGVRVETSVVETPVQEQVTLREEEVHVERRPVNQTIDPSAIDQLQTGTIEVRETGEQAVVSKEARVVEEVVIDKATTQRTETIQDTVRRTDVNVEEIGGRTTTTGYTDVSGTSSTMGNQSYSVSDTTGSTSSSTLGTTDSDMSSAAGRSLGGTASSTSGEQNEGLLSRMGNAAERATGLDLDRDGDVGQRN